MNGLTIQELRYAHGFSQQEFAELLGISRRTLSALEQSPEKLPLKYLARLRHLGIPPDDDEPSNTPHFGRASPLPLSSSSPPAASHASHYSPLVPVPDSFDTSIFNDTSTAPILALQDEEDCHDEEIDNDENEDDDAAEQVPAHFALPPEPLALESIPGNLFRILRQHLEITNARLVRFSGMKISDIEHAETGTALVSPTLFEAFVTAAETPALSTPDVLLAYLADALYKRTNESEKASPIPTPVIPALSAGSGKDATAIEAVHYKWAYDRVATELNDLKTEHRDVSRIAAERLAQVNELQRELDRLHVQQTLSDELGMQYADDLHDHKTRLNADFQLQQDRFIAAKTTALELLPTMLPILGTLAQNFRPKSADSHNFSHHSPPNHYAHHATPALHDPSANTCETGFCQPPPAPQRPTDPRLQTQQHTISQQYPQYNDFTHQIPQKQGHHQTSATSDHTSDYAETVS